MDTFAACTAVAGKALHRFFKALRRAVGSAAYHQNSAWIPLLRSTHECWFSHARDRNSYNRRADILRKGSLWTISSALRFRRDMVRRKGAFRTRYGLYRGVADF